MENFNFEKVRKKTTDSYKISKEKKPEPKKLGRLGKIGFVDFNLQDNSLYCSAVVYKILEKEKVSYIQCWEDYIETIHSNDQENYKKEHASFLAGLKDFNVEYRIILPDGTIKWIHEQGELIKEHHRTKICMQRTIQDITEYKKNIEKSTQNESLYKSFIQSQTNYIIRTDLEGSFTYFNDKFLEDFGSRFETKSILGNNSLSSLKQYHQNKIIAVVKKCLKHPNEIFQVAIDTSDTISTLWSFSSLTNAEGEFQEIHGFGIDISDRMNAEDSLIECDARYSLACKTTSDAIWDWESKSNRLFWGEGFTTLFGLDSGVFNSDRNKWESHLHPKDAAKAINDINAVIEGTSNYWHAEYRFKKADGSYAYVIDRAITIRDKKNKIIRIVGAIQDITEKKKLELLLEKVTSLSRIGSFEIDFLKNEVYWSDMAKEIHEVTSDYIPDINNLYSFYKGGVNIDSMEQSFKHSVKNNVPFDIETQIISSKGIERWVRVIAVPEFFYGKCMRIIGSFQDIDPIIKVKSEVVKANEEKEFILESIGDAFFALDYTGMITYWNKQSEKLLKFSKEKTIGKNIWQIFPDVVNSSFFTFYQKCIEEKENQHFEIYVHLINRWFEVSAYPSSKGISVFFKDISLGKKANSALLKLNKNLQKQTKELVTANKNLEQFSFILSHNLRAPVANILGLVNLLDGQDYRPEVKDNFLKEISDNVNRLDNIIIDLNNILKIRSNISLSKQVVNLENLISSITLGIQNLIEKEQIQIITRFEDIPELETVRSYLHSIFFNLIINSIKYRKDDSSLRIEISSEKNKEGVKIIYMDNGLGIDLAKNGKKIFGLYQRFHHHIEGKGMGLFMVKTQVETLGGEITVLSEVHKGTQFTLEFKYNNSNLITPDEKDD
ncbi:PAS domain-containing sensor histidine kinase [Flavobacterium sp. GT3P67]|uniref:PAS domain-containing sensor histidine kinase n=1 Tax=Flavobacterium sp. GT3P67 TaxID=2541722 RepID=UPI00104CD20C|nr:PAS domain-containing sensor histidine kinase [Flavobacterium sp. GT3P67]TDE48471.1 PAS domain-containing sensor histidine kinase [Flavobacterium sp. GT3P67]